MCGEKGGGDDLQENLNLFGLAGVWCKEKDDFEIDLMSFLG